MSLPVPCLVFDENRVVAPKISRKLLSYQRLSVKEFAPKNGRFRDNSSSLANLPHLGLPQASTELH
jgi:hypothetical protein